MDEKKNIEISEAAATLAEQRAATEGFGSVEAYVEALIEGDSDPFSDFDPDGLRGAIQEGLQSPAAPYSRERLRQLVSEGEARVAELRKK